MMDDTALMNDQGMMDDSAMVSDPKLDLQLQTVNPSGSEFQDLQAPGNINFQDFQDPSPATLDLDLQIWEQSPLHSAHQYEQEHNPTSAPSFTLGVEEVTMAAQATLRRPAYTRTSTSHENLIIPSNNSQRLLESNQDNCTWNLPDPSLDEADMVETSLIESREKDEIQQTFDTPFDWATPEVLNTHRVEITRLYKMHQLKEVMKIMQAKHGIKATQKMYKDRFNAWGLSKYKRHLKPSEVHIAIQQSFRRMVLEDKRSNVYVNNKPVSWKCIADYCKRRNITPRELLLREHFARKARSTRCVTPPLATPPDLEAPEWALRLLSNYIKGSLEAQNWIIDRTGNRLRSSKSSHRSRMALTIFQDYLATVTFPQVAVHRSRARLAVHRALMSVDTLIEAEPYWYVEELPRSLHSLVTVGQRKASLQLLESVARSADHHHGKFHPTYQYLMMLSRVKPVDMTYLLVEAMQLVSEIYSLIFGPQHTVTVKATSRWAKEKEIYTDVTAIYERLLHTCAGPGGADTMKLYMKVKLGWYHARRKQWKEARIIANDTIAAIQQSPDKRGLQKLKGYTHHLLGATLLRAGDLAEARKEVYEAVHAYEALKLYSESYFVLFDFARYLDYYGFPDEAREQRAKAIRDLDLGRRLEILMRMRKDWISNEKFLTRHDGLRPV